MSTKRVRILTVKLQKTIGVISIGDVESIIEQQKKRYSTDSTSGSTS
jgi:hypothetical protein